VARLDQRFELLSGGARTVLPRHRTLRAAVDWSYELLGEEEPALFDRLGVFPADFDYDAVQAVCASGGSGGSAVVRLLPALVDRSLVAAAGGDTPRYRLLESLRAYAAERLAASGADADLRRRHAAHYLGLAELAAGRLRGPEQRAWLERLTIEQPNLRAALDHSVGSGDTQTALRWVAALELFWDGTGQRREAHQWIRRILACGGPPATPASVAGLTAASALVQPWDDDAALDLAQRAAQLASGLGDIAARVGQLIPASPATAGREPAPVPGTGTGTPRVRRGPHPRPVAVPHKGAPDHNGRAASRERQLPVGREVHQPAAARPRIRQHLVNRPALLDHAGPPVQSARLAVWCAAARTGTIPPTGHGRTVLVASHVLSEVQQLVDQVVIVNNGRLVRQGTLAELSGAHQQVVSVRSPAAERLLAGAGPRSAMSSAIRRAGMVDGSADGVAVQADRQRGEHRGDGGRPHQGQDDLAGDGLAWWQGTLAEDQAA
jgi:hypothetical protein